MRWLGNTLRLCMCAALALAFGCGQPANRTTAAKAPPVITTKGGVDMVLLPAGEFEMGSRSGNADETPVHKVSVSAFLMDRCEVTQAQYDKLEIPHPSHFRAPANPVEMVGWGHAVAFCNARSLGEGLHACYNEESGACDFEADGYRLPTEAEWEYACRAGTTQDYSFGSDPRNAGLYAWFDVNAAKAAHPVGQKRPNPWGLYDLHGNVAEWCNDPYEDSFYSASPACNPRGPREGTRYVLRGGAWNSKVKGLRSSARIGETPGFQDACFARDAIGFRCVRKAPEKTM